MLRKLCGLTFEIPWRENTVDGHISEMRPLPIDALLGLILGAGDQIIVCARKEKEDWSAGGERVQFVSGAL